MRPVRDMEKETKKEEESDHRNHKHIGRKIYGPSTLVNFFRFGYEILLLIEFSCWVGLDLICFCFGFLKHRMIKRDTEIVFVNVAATSVNPASYHHQ